MINYAKRWKKYVASKQIPYNDFVSMDIKRAIFSRKVDGMLGAFIYQKSKQSFFQTTTGAKITDVPAITEYEVMLEKLRDIKSAVIIGELVAQKGTTILPFNATQSIVKTSYRPENKDLVFHYAVDVYSINGKRYSYRQALQFLFRNIGPGFAHVRIPKTKEGNLDIFRKMFLEIKGNPGYDGIVVREAGKRNYKVKFIETVDTVVIGAGNKNMPAWKKDQISYLLTAFMDRDGIFRTSSKIGTGFTDVQRRAFYSYIQKNKLYEKNGDIFIKPQLVVEFKYFRYMITETPSYKFTKNKYVEVGKKKSLTFSHPSFVRLRSDKKVNKDDLRLEQVPEFRY